jgi:hypothetical protein
MVIIYLITLLELYYKLNNEGMKADLKLFAIVSYTSPNEVYIYEEGLVNWFSMSKVKFKNEKFIELNEVRRHVNDDHRLSAYYQKLEKISKVKLENLKDEINSIIIQLIKLIIFQMRSEHEYEQTRLGINLYQLISFNFLITTTFKPICIGIDLSINNEQQNEWDNLSTIFISSKHINHLNTLKDLTKELLILAAPKRKLELM